jgi:hypothetical protein
MPVISTLCQWEKNKSEKFVVLRQNIFLILQPDGYTLEMGEPLG